MTTLLEASAVRIVAHPERGVVGAGFLAETDIIITCAHVIAEAAGMDEIPPTPPNRPISFDFPLVAPGQWLSATIIKWVPVQSDGSGDIAVLRLESQAPHGTKAARLVKSENHWDHPFRAFGYPRQQDDGVPSSGKLTSLNAKGWVVMQTTDATGFRVQQGFSGAGVWDGELDGIAGMVVAEETDPVPRVAYMIPSRVLIEAWPALGQQAIPPSPYRSLFAFREQDASFFFGREAFTQRLVDTVRRNPLVAVIGSSGSGKTSLVYAGLLPHLRKEGTWAIATFRPRSRPLYSLAKVLLDLLEPQVSPSERLPKIQTLTSQLEHDKVAFTNVVDLILHTQVVARLLLVIDQFEELYTECKVEEEIHRFLDLLLTVQASSQQAKSPLVVVCTLRADFLGQALTYRPLADALQQSDLKLGPMKREELQEAINKPAEKLQIQIEDGLTNRILEDVGVGAGNLPLLEFALTSLWAKQQDGMLTHAAYEAIGGVKRALSDHAEAVWEGFSEAEQVEAQQIFTQLVHPGESTEDTRRVATRVMLSEARWQLVSRMADERLVVTGLDATTGQETVEVIHEALIQNWERLRGWIDADRKWFLWLDGLRTIMRQWERKQRDAGALLRGGLLREALDWLAQRPNALAEGELAFIRASQEQERQEQREREHLEAQIKEARRLEEEAERRRQEQERQERQERERLEAQIKEARRREEEAERRRREEEAERRRWEEEAERRRWRVCKNCDGTGERERVMPFGGGSLGKEKCYVCHGTGKVLAQ